MRFVEIYCDLLQIQTEVLKKLNRTCLYPSERLLERFPSEHVFITNLYHFQGICEVQGSMKRCQLEKAESGRPDVAQNGIFHSHETVLVKEKECHHATWDQLEDQLPPIWDVFIFLDNGDFFFTKVKEDFFGTDGRVSSTKKYLMCCLNYRTRKTDCQCSTSAYVVRPQCSMSEYVLRPQRTLVPESRYYVRVDVAEPF